MKCITLTTQEYARMHNDLKQYHRNMHLYARRGGSHNRFLKKGPTGAGGRKIDNKDHFNFNYLSTIDAFS